MRIYMFTTSGVQRKGLGSYYHPSHAPPPCESFKKCNVNPLSPRNEENCPDAPDLNIKLAIPGLASEPDIGALHLDCVV